MSLYLAPALKDPLRQLGAPYDDSRRLLVEANPAREQEVRVAVAEQPDFVRNLVDLSFPADYPADRIGVRPVHPPQWHVEPRTISLPGSKPQPAPTGDLAEFLLARIAEDQRVALAATPNTWHVDPWRNSSGVEFLVVAHETEGPPAFAIKSESDAEHIARCDPARVLAECEAKRRIVELHKPYRRIYGLGCDVCLQPRHLPADAPGWPCLTLRLLALPYADDPDYRQEWKP